MFLRVNHGGCLFLLCVLVRLCTMVAKYLTDQLKEGMIYFTCAFRAVVYHEGEEEKQLRSLQTRSREREYWKQSSQDTPH